MTEYEQVRSAVSDEIDSKCEEFAKAVLIIGCIVFLFIHPMISAGLFVLWVAVLMLSGVFKSLAGAAEAIVARLELSRRSIDG